MVGRLIYRQTSAPAAPLSGVIALWVDTSTAADPQLKIWDGTAWVAAHAIADNAVVNRHLAPGSVTEDILADSAVTTRKIAPRAVEASRIAPGSILAPLVAADAIATASIQDGAITAAKLAPDIISNQHIVAGQVRNLRNRRWGGDGTEVGAQRRLHQGHRMDDSITHDKLQGNSVDADNMRVNSIVPASIQAGAVERGKIAAGAVTDAELADDSVGNTELKPEVQTQLVPGGGAQNQVLQKRTVRRPRRPVGACQSSEHPRRCPRPPITDRRCCRAGSEEAIQHRW